MPLPHTTKAYGQFLGRDFNPLDLLLLLRTVRSCNHTFSLLTATKEHAKQDMRIYADTSVFGGVFDEEFSEPTKRFFSEIDAGRFTIVTSAIVEAEIEPAPKKIRDFFARYEAFAEIAQITQEMLLLQQQ